MRGTPSISPPGGAGFRLSRGGGSIVIDANGAIDYNVPAAQAHTFQVNAVDLFTIGPTNATLASGQLIVPDGSKTLPSVAFAGDTVKGFFGSAGDQIRLADNGNEYFAFSKDGRVSTVAAGRYSWMTGTDLGGAVDLSLFRDAAFTLAQRDGVNAETSHVYGTFTDLSNYERLASITAAGDYLISPAAAGTGTLRGLQLVASGGRLGFYGTTAIAQQTGVAVTAAGIHAACVALGLFTA